MRAPLLAPSLLLLAACAHAPVSTTARPAPNSRFLRPQAGLAADAVAAGDRHCPAGAPRWERAIEYGPTVEVEHDGFLLLHGTKDRIPLWVCERITTAQLRGELVREGDPFKPDPKLPPGARAELSDYKGSGYDRGHMAAAGNQTVSKALKDETFLLSNMTPQEPMLNQRMWKALEEKARGWLDARGGGWIITGAFFYDPKEESEATANGLIDHFLIGKNGVAVPTHYYKVVVVRRGDAYEAIAFVAENRPYPAPYDFTDWIRAIDWIEARAGFDLLPSLSAAEADRLEARPATLWP